MHLTLANMEPNPFRSYSFFFYLEIFAADLVFLTACLSAKLTESNVSEDLEGSR